MSTWCVSGMWLSAQQDPAHNLTVTCENALLHTCGFVCGGHEGSKLSGCMAWLLVVTTESMYCIMLVVVTISAVPDANACSTCGALGSHANPCTCGLPRCCHSNLSQ